MKKAFDNWSIIFLFFAPHIDSLVHSNIIRIKHNNDFQFWNGGGLSGEARCFFPQTENGWIKLMKHEIRKRNARSRHNVFFSKFSWY